MSRNREGLECKEVMLCSSLAVTLALMMAFFL